MPGEENANILSHIQRNFPFLAAGLLFSNNFKFLFVNNELVPINSFSNKIFTQK